MKYTLKDYQDDAVRDVLSNLRKARIRWHAANPTDRERSAFALSAPTASGKTVIAGAVLEALLHGNDDYDFSPDPGAVVIWMSDDPSLNEQSRYRLLECADRLEFSDMVVVESTFNREKFESGKIYFLNTQKLGKNSLLTRGQEAAEELEVAGVYTLPTIRPDGRDYTIWDTIENTSQDEALTLYLVLDEAHRGMGATTKANADTKATIVKRVINGNGALSAMPIVWGISATVERFAKALGAASGRTRLADIVVDTVRVQESGLLKDTVALEVPGEVGKFDTVLLRRAADKLRNATDAWDAYTAGQDLEPVHPLMVFQVPNTPDPDEIGQALKTIFDELPSLPYEAIAHVFGEHKTHAFGAYEVPYIAPERVQESTWVRVLIAKDAISTGWDCPRAEVMVSFRPAKDRTHITQLLGRLIRTPLARQIPGNDTLNAVHCILPLFDLATVQTVVAELTGETADHDDKTPVLRRVLIDPIQVTPNPVVDERVWGKLLSLPSQTLPQRAARPVKRLTALAHALASDGLLGGAGKKAHSEMHKALDAFRVRYDDAVAAARTNVLTVEGRTVNASLMGGNATFDDFVEAADLQVIEDAYRRAARILSPDIARTYAEYLADRNADADDIEEALVEAHTDIAAIGLLPEVQAYLDGEADKLASKWLNEFRVDRKNLSDDRQAVYRQIIEMSTEPQDVEIAQPVSWMVPATEQSGDVAKPLRRFDGHLMADDDGKFPADVNTWETQVIDRETKRNGFLTWYRNPSRSTKDSLAIAYRDGDRYRTVRPDFLFFAQAPDGTVVADVVDPHGHHLGDALPKLRGMADYAETHAGHYRRIEAVAELDGKLRVLDLTSPTVRRAVAEARDARSLYAGSAASDY